EIRNFSRDLARPRCQRCRLLAIELELLLPAIQLELTSVRVFADRPCVRVGFGLLDSQASKRCLHFSAVAGRRRFALAGVRQPTARAVDAVLQLAILPR